MQLALMSRISSIARVLRAAPYRPALTGSTRGSSRQRPTFIKSLDIDHARDGEVMIAYAMNGQPLPLLNGFPLRLIVPGWYSTYWVKMLNDIEVLDHPDDNFWMSKAYRDTGHTPTPTSRRPNRHKVVPINRMVPRSFFTNLTNGRESQPPASRNIAGHRLWR